MAHALLLHPASCGLPLPTTVFFEGKVRTRGFVHHVTGPLALPARDSGQCAGRVVSTVELSDVLVGGHLGLRFRTSCIAATTLAPRSLTSSLIISLEEFLLDAGAPLGYPLAQSLFPSTVTGAHLLGIPDEEVHLLVRAVT